MIVIGNNIGEIILEYYLNKNLNIDNIFLFFEFLLIGFIICFIRFELVGV